MKTIGARFGISRRAALYVLVLFLALVPVYANVTADLYLITEFRRIVILAIVAVSLDFVLGYGGMVCFGQAMFFGIGAYAAALYSLHLGGGQDTGPGMIADASIVWIVAALAGALSALVVGAISLRTTGVYFIMITLAFAQLAYFVFIGMREWGGDEGLRYEPARQLLGVLDLNNQMVSYYVAFAILFGVVFVLHRLVQSPFGLVIEGSKENDRRMHGLGFNTFWYRLACFTIGGAVAGLAGGLFASNEGFVSPSMLAWNRSGEFIVMVLIGGAATLVGPVLGAIIFLVLESFLPEYSEHWMLFFGPALVVIVLTFSRGLYGSLAAPARPAPPDTVPTGAQARSMEERHA